MSSHRAPVQQMAKNQKVPEEAVTNAFQQLLSVQNGTDTDGQNELIDLQQAIPGYAAVATRKQIDNQSTRIPVDSSPLQPLFESLAVAVAGVQGIAQQVRAEFVALADMEIRRIVNGVANGEVYTSAQPNAQLSQAYTQPALPAPQKGAQRTKRKKSGPRKQTRGARAGAGDTGLYEGTVRLQVLAGGDMQHVVRFAEELCRKPQFRLQRMTGNSQRGGAEVCLGLREPLPLCKILSEMRDVLSVDGEVEPGHDGARIVTVRIAANA